MNGNSLSVTTAYGADTDSAALKPSLVLANNTKEKHIKTHSIVIESYLMYIYDSMHKQ